MKFLFFVIGDPTFLEKLTNKNTRKNCGRRKAGSMFFFFRPDYDRRLRNFTEIGFAKKQSSQAVTAGEEFHLALKIHLSLISIFLIPRFVNGFLKIFIFLFQEPSYRRESELRRVPPEEKRFRLYKRSAHCLCGKERRFRPAQEAKQTKFHPP